MLGTEETAGFSAEESDLTIKVRAASCSVSSRTGSSAGEATAVVAGETGGLSASFRSEGPRITCSLFVDRNVFRSSSFGFKEEFDVVEIRFFASVLIGNAPSFLSTELDYFVPHLLVQPPQGALLGPRTV
jgi:hypothetical protein